MPRLLVVGHVTWDLWQGREVLGGPVSYAALAARKLDWEAGVLTAAGADFDPARDLPGVTVFLCHTGPTTRFRNRYEEDGTRHQILISQSSPIELVSLPVEWRSPDVLLLGPVASELSGSFSLAFEATVVGALGQGWLRDVDSEGNITPRVWKDPRGDLAGVHVLFLSERELPHEHVRAFLDYVPIVILTRGWKGVRIHTREGVQEIPALPRPEMDPTGAGDVFAAAFLVRYQETSDVSEAAAFAVCAASCVVEGIGQSALGTRAEVTRRLALWERLIEEGDWDESG